MSIVRNDSLLSDILLSQQISTTFVVVTLPTVKSCLILCMMNLFEVARVACVGLLLLINWIVGLRIWIFVAHIYHTIHQSLYALVPLLMTNTHTHTFCLWIITSVIDIVGCDNFSWSTELTHSGQVRISASHRSESPLLSKGSISFIFTCSLGGASCTRV